MKRFNNFTRRSVSALALALFLTLLGAVATQAQTTTFTYQGRFTDTTAAQPTNGTYTMTFRLFNAETGGTQIGTDITSAVSVVNNLFTVKLNFGAGAFNTTGARYLEIQVGNTILTPRQEITAAPFANRAVNAASADSLSSACVGCVTNAQIGSVDGSKVTGTVASATTASTANTATTAGNVTGVVAIANGGTGSSTKNFVDTTTAQTNIGGNKTFNNTVTANLFSAGSSGVAMNNNFLRLRGSNDNNHGMLWNSTIDGPEFRGNSGFLWTTGTSGVAERMSLDGSGNLTVNGTISGTLANNTVGTAQVADGSLRLADTAVYNVSLGASGGTFAPHSCLQFTIAAGTIPGLAANDIITFIPPVSSPAGFYFQSIYVSGAGTFNFPVCNTSNANNTLPAQSYRIFVQRP